MTALQIISMLGISLWVTVSYIASLLYVIDRIKKWKEKRKQNNDISKH